MSSMSTKYAMGGIIAMTEIKAVSNNALLEFLKLPYTKTDFGLAHKVQPSLIPSSLYAFLEGNSKDF